MSMIEQGFLFSNIQDVSGNATSTVSSNVSSKNNAPTNKDAWGANKNAQIGGMTVVVVTQTENVAGGNMTPYLMTHTANNLNAAGTVVHITEFDYLNMQVGVIYTRRVLDRTILSGLAAGKPSETPGGDSIGVVCTSIGSERVRIR